MPICRRNTGLLTALLNTDGTTLGITQGANTANARYVAGQIAGESGRKQFITKEQVEYAAQALFGEEVEIAHQSVPGGCRSPGAIPVL